MTISAAYAIRTVFDHKSLRYLSALPALLTLALALAGCSSSANNAAAAPAASATAHNATLSPAQLKNIQFYTVATTNYHKTLDTSGAVDFDNDQATSVLAPFGGPVSKLVVALGDPVKKGDALAIVDSPDFAAATSAYSKALATAVTNRKLADIDKDLLQHNGIAQKEATQAQTDAENAEADRDAALLALVALNVDARVIKDIQAGRPTLHVQSVIRSPISGTVVEKLITPGQLLQAGTTPCFTVADLSRVWVTAQIFGADVAAIKLGDTAEIVTGTQAKNLVGKVDNIGALVDPNTRAVGVRVVVDNPNGVLKKQMYVRVQIRAHEENSGLLVPVSAILRDDENLPFVYLVQSDGSFARQHVTVGYRSEDRYDISDGLKAGDKIVVDGGIFVQFMQDQ
jgi:cobalt-zinc-cadmium efflux system membrane fusion protein